MKCVEKTKKGTDCRNNAKNEGRCNLHHKIFKAKGKECITITFGDVAENHVRMQKIGKMAECGISYEELKKTKENFEENKFKCELIDLSTGLVNTEESYNGGDAYILVVREGLKAFCDPDNLFKEQRELNWDTKAKMYNKVVNKNARYNLCFADKSQEPDYENGKGRIVNFDKLTFLSTVRTILPKFLGDKCNNLMGEGNRYYDSNKCGIGFHGDAERRIVIAIRLGESMPLDYFWWKNSKCIGERIELKLNHGDMYIMSDKATGYDWKKKKILTLRHAAGAKKYRTIKL